MISAVDDSENVFVHFFNMESRTCNVRQCNIKRLKIENEKVSQSIKSKHFFGMGYPYFITGYDSHVAVTTDYGILLFRIERNGTAVAK